MVDLLKAYENRIRHLQRYKFKCYNCKRPSLRLKVLDKDKVGTSDSFPFCYKCYRDSFSLDLKKGISRDVQSFLNKRRLLLLEDHRPGLLQHEYENNKRRIEIPPYKNVFISENWFTYQKGVTHALAVVEPEKCPGLKQLNELYDEVGSYPILITKQYLTPPNIKDETFFMNYIALMTPEMNILSYYLSNCFLSFFW